MTCYDHYGRAKKKAPDTLGARLGEKLATIKHAVIDRVQFAVTLVERSTLRLRQRLVAALVVQLLEHGTNDLHWFSPSQKRHLTSLINRPQRLQIRWMVNMFTLRNTARASSRYQFPLHH